MTEPAAAEWTERDVLLATAQTLKNLMAWLVIAKAVPEEKIAGIVEISARQLDKEQAAGAARAVRGLFEGALTGEWARMATLVDPNNIRGSG